MPLDYRLHSLLLLSFILPTLVNAIPHPQDWANNRRPRPDTNGVVVTPPTTTTVPEDGNVDVRQAVVDNDDDTTTPPASGAGKRGLAFNEASPSLESFTNSDITWVHNWHSQPGNAPSEFLFVPTLWSDKSPHSDNWDTLANGHPYLMSFNEPDIVAQANMAVGDAVSAYTKLMFPKRTGSVKIGAPSVCSGSGTNEAGIPMGTSWLRQFLEQCNDPNTCVADFVSGHWYGCPDGTCSVDDDVKSFQNYVDDVISVAEGREVWIPEFQRYGDPSQQKEFLDKVMPWLDASAVARYAYFMVRDGILTTDGRVNELGAAFAGV
ncbi:MAG: hypothetical protein Q9178_005210 [Gyalolechia marmorata]